MASGKVEAGPVPDIYREPERASRIAMIADSFERLLGRALVEPDRNVVQAMWEAPRVILAHGTEADPIYFFGNAKALAAFEYDVAQFVALPSRLSAEALLREERQALLDRVTANGFIDDYRGIRISATGRRFRIADAIVWNLEDREGRYHGQAATFLR